MRKTSDSNARFRSPTWPVRSCLFSLLSADQCLMLCGLGTGLCYQLTNVWDYYQLTLVIWSSVIWSLGRLVTCVEGYLFCGLLNVFSLETPFVCLCVDVSVSSLNDGFFLLHTDTEDNSGKVWHTHMYAQTDEQVKKVKSQVLDIAPLNKRSTYQRRFDNRGSGAWLTLVIVRSPSRGAS